MPSSFSPRPRPKNSPQRCCPVASAMPFARIAVPVMIDRMREIAAAEGIAIGDDALAAIAYRADGGLRDALTMLEQAAAFAGGETIGAAKRSTAPSVPPAANSANWCSTRQSTATPPKPCGQSKSQ